MPHYKLTYLDLNARGEPIRLFFALAGVEFDDIRIPIAQWKDNITEAPFLAYPMLEVNGVKIAQTLAILRYLAKQYGFAGPDNLTSALADALNDQFTDFVMSWMGWHYCNKGYSNGGDKDQLYEKEFVPARAKNLPFFEEALRTFTFIITESTKLESSIAKRDSTRMVSEGPNIRSSTGWFVNTPDVTHADVFIAASIEFIIRLVPDPSAFLDGFPLLQDHQKKFTQNFRNI